MSIIDEIAVPNFEKKYKRSKARSKYSLNKAYSSISWRIKYIMENIIPEIMKTKYMGGV